jgi:hypothetical protein
MVPCKSTLPSPGMYGLWNIYAVHEHKFFLKKNLDVVLGPNKGLTIKIGFPKSIKMESGLSLIIWGLARYFVKLLD